MDDKIEVRAEYMVLLPGDLQQHFPFTFLPKEESENTK